MEYYWTQRLAIVLSILSEKKLYAKFKKCEFQLNQVTFLGHIFSRNGISIESFKVEVVVNWKSPIIVAKIKSFLRLASYHRRFVEGFSKIVAPLTQLTIKDVKFEWNAKCEKSFQELKR